VSDGQPGPSLCPEDPAYIIYTSGTTGRPKGIVVPHQTLLNLIEWHESKYPPGPVAQSTSISFDVSLQEIAEALLRGETLVIVSDADRADAARFASTIQANAVAHVFASQTLLEHLIDGAQEQGIHLRSLRGLYQAGEPLRVTPRMRSFFERHRDCHLFNHYGPAETHVVTSLTLTNSPSSWATTPTIGQPIWAIFKVLKTITSTRILQNPFVF
jgi:non-ribosomal peptide synthetase component F